MRHFRHYTDHEVLKILNTPHTSGKLARWGMTLQEHNHKIEYRPGRSNECADTLSRYPIAAQLDKPTVTGTPVVVGSIQATTTEAQSGEETADVQECLSQQRYGDPHLGKIMQYLQSGVLPKDDVEARCLNMREGQYSLLDGVL